MHDLPVPIRAAPGFREVPHDVVELLSGVQLFSGLTTEHLQALAAQCVIREVGSGFPLFAAGDEPRGLYVVQRGRVRIYRTGKEGKEQVLHVEGPGRSVAELPLLDGGRHPASAITLEETRLVFLPRAAFDRLCRENCEAAQGIIRALCRRLRHFVQITETLAFRDVAARLALRLADYADRLGVPTTRGVELRLVRTQEELAREIGTARESVSRALRQLRSIGVVQSLSGGTLLIPSVDELRALARGDHRSTK